MREHTWRPSYLGTHHTDAGFGPVRTCPPEAVGDGTSLSHTAIGHMVSDRIIPLTGRYVVWSLTLVER